MFRRWSDQATINRRTELTLRSYEHKIGSLSNQVVALTDAKEALLSIVEKEREKTAALRADLGYLRDDYELLSQERSYLEDRVERLETIITAELQAVDSAGQQVYTDAPEQGDVSKPVTQHVDYGVIMEALLDYLNVRARWDKTSDDQGCEIVTKENSQ